MGSEELLSVNGLKTILVEPFCDLFERPTLLTKLDSRIVKELLVLRIDRRK